MSKKRIARYLAPSILLLGLTLATTAMAGKTLLATCTGAGARLVLTDLSELDAATVYGLPAPPADDATLVVSTDGDEAHWSQSSRRDIDRQCGGDGTAKINLFPPIQPRDGTWNMHLSEQRLDGCSGLMARAVKAGMQRVTGTSKTHAFDFATPFHPRPLMARDKNVHWVQTDLNRWRAVLNANQGSAQSMTFTVTVDAEVHSPTRITEVERFHIRTAPSLARILGGSGECHAAVTVELNWAGR